MSSSIPVVKSSPALLFEDIGHTTELVGGSVVPAVTNVIVHPLVLFHVLDHHARRQEGRVIGTLLGRRDGSTVEVTNCFAVTHAERGDEVAIGKDFNKKMLALHARQRTKEIVVGWYASASDDCDAAVTDTSSLIHEFYSGETEDGDPIHLVVDTRLQDDVLKIAAYKSARVIVQSEHIGYVFHELKLTLQNNEYENICQHEMIRGNTDHGTAALQVSIEKLYALLESTLEYVDAVVEGKLPADAEKGRQIADTLAVIPSVRPEIFDKLFHDSLQDLLMVTYLSNMTRTQIAIAEKLNASLGST